MVVSAARFQITRHNNQASAAQLSSAVTQKIVLNDSFCDLWRSTSCATSAPGHPPITANRCNVFSRTLHAPRLAADLSTAGTVLMAQSAASGAAESSVATRGLAPPPTPLQTAGALLGALFAIVLAIAGVTLTFRSMRNEMRRGRGRSRRTSRSERTTLPQT